MYVDRRLQTVRRASERRRTCFRITSAEDEVLKVLSTEDREQGRHHVAWSDQHVMICLGSADITLFSIATWECVFSHTLVNSDVYPAVSPASHSGEAFLRLAPDEQTLLISCSAGQWVVGTISLSEIGLCPRAVNAELPFAYHPQSEYADEWVRGQQVQHPLCSAVAALQRTDTSEEPEYHVTLTCGPRIVKSASSLQHFLGEALHSHCCSLDGEVRWAREGLGVTFQCYETMVCVRLTPLI